jgi:hypothetical protein
MCAGHTLLPRSLHFELPDNSTGGVECRGGSADVLKRECRGREVAVKTLRTRDNNHWQDITNVSHPVVSNSMRVLSVTCAEVLQGGHNLEIPSASEYITLLLGVIMTENQFAMVSEWMAGGNINQFVTAHRNANRFELVSSPFKTARLAELLLMAISMTSTVGRCCEGLDLHARPGNDPW